MQTAQATITPFTGYEKFIIVVLALLQFTVVLDFMVMSPLGDLLMKSLDMSPAMFGLAVSAYAFSAGISGILAAGFADKYDRKSILLFFYSGFVIGTWLCGISHTYYMLLFARIITGVFGGVIAAIGMSIVGDLFRIDQRGRVMGFIQMAFAGSQILGIPISLFLANIWGWNAPFFMIVILSIILGLVVWKWMRPVNAHLTSGIEKNPMQHLWNTLNQSDYRVGFFATALLSIGGFMLMPFGSAFMVNNVGVAQTQLPYVFMFTGLSSMFIMPIIGRLSDKISKAKLFAFGSVLSIIMILIYTQLGIAPLWFAVIINMLLFMSIMSRIVPCTALVMSLPVLKDRGAFMSINSSLQQMAGGIASIIAGLIVVQKSKASPLENFDLVGIISSLIILTSIFIIYKVQRILVNKKQI